MIVSRIAALTAALAISPLQVLADAPVPGEWRHELKVDPADGSKTCSVQKGNGDLPFLWFLYGHGGVWAGMVGEMSLGDLQRFQVDAKPPIEESDRLTGARVRELLTQIRGGGKTLKVTFVDFPARKTQTQELSLAGVIEQLDACKVAMAAKTPG